MIPNQFIQGLKPALKLNDKADNNSETPAFNIPSLVFNGRILGGRNLVANSEEASLMRIREQQAESAALALGDHGVILGIELRLRLGEARAIQKTHRNSESGPGCACVDGLVWDIQKNA